MNGTVKTKTDKGYGFISREGEEKDLFFHSNDLSGVTFDELQVGASVEFDVVDGDKGQSEKLTSGSQLRSYFYSAGDISKPLSK
jgi:CspA family cold shock protein